MPPLLLYDEAIATLLGLAALGATGNAREGSLDDAAIRACGKVDQYLPKQLRPRVTALPTGLETTPTPGISAQTMSTLAEAITHERVATCHYVGANGAATSRRVEPCRQIHLLLKWYLLGWDTGLEDWRVFRIDRVSQPQAQRRRFAPRAPPAGT